MADVAVSEPTQSLMSIVAHDGPEETGSATLVSSTKQTRKTRVRKVRPPDLKGRRGREDKKDLTMVNRTPQRKDYLSQQRSKRLEKQKSKGKREGLTKSKETASQDETKDDEVKEGEEETVGDEDDTRGLSATSSISKDEGISSNGEKDEDFELDERESGAKTDVQGEGQEVDDDEGRGSINGDDDEAPTEAPHSDQGAVEGVEGDNIENMTEELVAKEQAEEEDKTEDVGDDTTGYQGDMDEPNSLAASSQGSFGFSSDGGLGTTADLSQLKRDLEDMTVTEKDESEEAKPDQEEHAETEEEEELSGEAQEDLGEATGETEAEAENELINETEKTNQDEVAQVLSGIEEQDEDESSDKAEEDKEEVDEDAATRQAETEDATQIAAEDEEKTPGEDDEEGGTEGDEESAEKVTGDEIVEGAVTEEGEGKDGTEEEEEEEIKEIPAIARIPGTYRRGRRNVAARTPRQQEPEVKKTPKTKKYDSSKMMANRKPISWRPTPIQQASRPEATQQRSNLLQTRKFRARNLTRKSVEDVSKDGEGEEAAADDEDNKEGDSQASQEGTAIDSLEIPPVIIPAAGDDDSPVALNTFRSEGHNSQGDTQTEDGSQGMNKAESMPEISYHDLTRPNTAGKKDRGVRRKKRRPQKGSVSTRSVVSQQGGKAPSTSEVWVPEEDKLYVYTYSSQPRLLHVRRMAAGRVATTHQYDQDPNSSFRLRTRGNGNPMYDRRVVRGSNYAKRLSNGELPKWNPYFTNARSLEQHQEQQTEQGGSQQQQHHHQRRQEFREKLEARARLRRENHGVSSLYPSHTGGHHLRHYPRVHVHVQTENNYEPLERPPETEVEVQTEPWTEDGSIPPIVFQSPPGVDADTQVDEGELDAGDEQGAVVAALVSRTLKEAVLEVMQEEQAEEDRINKLATASLPSFAKPVELNGEKKEDKGKEDSATEEREDPDGKETSPQDTEEPARSPEPEGDQPEVKEIKFITTVETTTSSETITHDPVKVGPQESEPLVIWEGSV